MKKVICELLTENALIPKKGTIGSVGFDLFAAYKVNIPPNNCSLVLTDITIKLPTGIYGRIASRSGLALFNKLNVLGGVIGITIFINFL
jgi:dUTP pyrophosphatase